MFNEPEINALLRKQTTHEVDRTDDLAPSSAGQVPGTMSRLREWYGYNDKLERAFFIGLFHYYKQPDGNLGGSGKEDPKMLIINGRMLTDP